MYSHAWLKLYLLAVGAAEPHWQVTQLLNISIYDIAGGLNIGLGLIEPHIVRTGIPPDTLSCHCAATYYAADAAQNSQ